MQCENVNRSNVCTDESVMQQMRECKLGFIIKWMFDC